MAVEQPTVFPHPAREHLWVSGLSSGESTWEVFDIHGQLCQSGHTLHLTSIDVSGLQTGFYLVQVRTSRSSQAFKFLKRELSPSPLKGLEFVDTINTSPTQFLTM
jgi:hypothetical protein